MKKLIDSCDEEDRKEMLNMVIDDNGWKAPERYKNTIGYDTLLNQAKTEEMKKLIEENL